MKTLLITFVTAGTLAAFGTARSTTVRNITHSEEQTMETHILKAAANNAFLALFRDYSDDGVRTYIDADHIQHNPFVPTGREARHPWCRARASSSGGRLAGGRAARAARSRTRGRHGHRPRANSYESVPQSERGT